MGKGTSKDWENTLYGNMFQVVNFLRNLGIFVLFFILNKRMNFRICKN